MLLFSCCRGETCTIWTTDTSTHVISDVLPLYAWAGKVGYRQKLIPRMIRSIDTKVTADSGDDPLKSKHNGSHHVFLVAVAVSAAMVDAILINHHLGRTAWQKGKAAECPRHTCRWQATARKEPPATARPVDSVRFQVPDGRALS